MAKGQKGFQKGRSGNPNGRPVSSPTIVLRNKIQQFAVKNIDVFLEEIKRMPPSKTKSDSIMALLNFILPKLSAGDHKLDISKLTDEEVTRVIELTILENEQTRIG